MWLWPARSQVPFDPDAAPDVGPVGRWLYGVALAAGPVALGVYCLLAGRAWFVGRGIILEVTGAAAVGLSIMYIGAGGFVHFHFFWATHQKLWRLARPGKALSLVAFVGGLGVAIVRTLL